MALPAAAEAAPLPDTGANGEWWFVAWDVAKIWDLGAQGQGISVAVLDTGVNPSVAGLSRVLGPGIDITTNSGNGRTDRDETGAGHGTRMIAFIAGQGGRGGEVGVAPQARILPVTVEGAENPAGAFTSGIRWSADHGARVISISQSVAGADCPAGLQDAVAYAVRKGAVVVASAGNEGDGANLTQYPANCRGVLSVGAVDINRHVWPSSQRQPYVDVAAPGVHMHAVDANGDQGYSNGTSDATALVSGAVALVWSKYPQLSNRQVVARILATLKDDADRPGRDDAAGGGIVRPYNAISQNVPANAPNPVFDELAAAPSPPNTPTGSASTACTAGPAACAPSAAPSGGGGGSNTALLVGVLVAVLAAVSGVLIWVVASQRRRAAAAQAARWPAQPPLPPPGHPPQDRGWPR